MSGHRGRGRPPRPGLIAGLLAVTAACAGCTGLNATPSPPAGTPSPPAATAASRQASSGRADPPKAQPPLSCAARVTAGMSQAQRAGQLFIVGLPPGVPTAATARAITAHHFGSAFITTDTTTGVSGVRAITSAVSGLASARATAKVGYLIAANQEGGQVQALQGPGFATIPPALSQGGLPPSVLARQAFTWGRELRAAGINLNFAPVMGVVPAATASQNQPIGALQREFGHNPATVGAHGAAFIRGMRRAGVATTAKHFPGLGLVRGNTDFTAGVVDTVTTPGGPYLRGFQRAIGAGVPFVMVSTATYTRIDPHHLAAFSPTVMRTLLRGRMHFQGVIVSDDLGVAAAVAAVPPARRAFRFLDAGGDLITSAAIAPAVTMYHAVLRRARSDPAFRDTVDAAAARIIAAKQALGLVHC